MISPRITFARINIKGYGFSRFARGERIDVKGRQSVIDLPEEPPHALENMIGQGQPVGALGSYIVATFSGTPAKPWVHPLGAYVKCVFLDAKDEYGRPGISLSWAFPISGQPEKDAAAKQQLAVTHRIVQDQFAQMSRYVHAAASGESDLAAALKGMSDIMERTTLPPPAAPAPPVAPRQVSGPVRTPQRSQPKPRSGWRKWFG